MYIILVWTPVQRERAIGYDTMARVLEQLVIQTNQSRRRYYMAVDRISYAARDWIL